MSDQFGSGLHITAHALDGAHGLHHQVATVTGGAAGFTGRFRGAHGVARHFFHSAGHFGDGGGGLFNLVVLLLQATGTFVGNGIQLFGG